MRIEHPRAENTPQLMFHVFYINKNPEGNYKLVYITVESQEQKSLCDLGLGMPKFF